MVPAEFEYCRPGSLDETLDILSARGPDCQVMAGGQSLLPLLKLRLAQPGMIVDLSHLPELTALDIGPERIVIGAMVTERAVELSPEIEKLCPTLADTARVIADPHVRNLGTIGGSLCMADPRGDLPACMLALEATFDVASRSGTRTIPAADFYTGPFSTALGDDELLVSISVPLKPRSSGAYLKLSKRAGDFAVVAAAVCVTRSDGGSCEMARVALCAVGSTPVLVPGLEGILVDTRLEDDAIDAAAKHASSAVEPLEDPLVSVAYRRAMIETMTGRGLRLARDRLEATA